jgi:hypothetical protein
MCHRRTQLHARLKVSVQAAVVQAFRFQPVALYLRAAAVVAAGTRVYRHRLQRLDHRNRLRLVLAALAARLVLILAELEAIH